MMPPSSACVRNIYPRIHRMRICTVVYLIKLYISTFHGRPIFLVYIRDNAVLHIRTISFPIFAISVIKELEIVQSLIHIIYNMIE